MALIEIRMANWQQAEDRHLLSGIRREVFIEEQGVAEDIELDAHDAGSLHVLAASGNGRVVGCARVMPNGQIGRMAVLLHCRGAGIGARLLQAAIAAAQDAGLNPIFLHAQRHAEGFYRRFGFTPIGDAFHEADIEHIKMTLKNEPAEPTDELTPR